MLTRCFFSLSRNQHIISLCSRAFFSKEEGNHGIKFDEEQIKKKMQDIKKRK